MAPLVAVVTVLAALTAVLAGCGRSSGGGTDWLALGDSYSSGEGTADSDGTCGQSPGAYAPLAHEAVGGGGRFDFLACTGARIDEVEAQLATVGDARFDVVTVSVGGNDAGYAAVLADCIGLDELRAAVFDGRPGEFTFPIAACTTTGDELEARIEAVLPRLRALYERIVTDHLADGGRLVVVGYPQLFEDPSAWPPEEGERCDGVAAADVEELRAAGGRLDDAQAALVATIPEATFVDPREAFSGHGRCSADPWLNGFELRPRPKASFHPNDAGQQALAELVTEAADRS